MKGLRVSTLRNADLGNCTNGGVSAKYNSFILTGEGVPEIFKPGNDCPELKLVYRPGINYYHAEPVEGRWENSIGWMFGGNYITSSDSRFPNRYPIPIHDRQETQAQYDTLST